MDPKSVVAKFKARLIQAKGLSKGERFQNEKVRVRHLADYLEVTDLTNAGKRGKQCPQFITRAEYVFGDTAARTAWLGRISDMFLDYVTTSDPYLRMRSVIKDIREDGRQTEIYFEERKLKGIEVEPFGTIFDLKIKLKDGKSELQVHGSPNEFWVVDHHWQSAGFYQDTSYHTEKRKDAQVAYAWLRDNLSKANQFESIQDFRNVWTVLGVKYRYH